MTRKDMLCNNLIKKFDEMEQALLDGYNAKTERAKDDARRRISNEINESRDIIEKIRGSEGIDYAGDSDNIITFAIAERFSELMEDVYPVINKRVDELLADPTKKFDNEEDAENYIHDHIICEEVHAVADAVEGVVADNISNPTVEEYVKNQVSLATDGYKTIVLQDIVWGKRLKEIYGEV